MNSSEREISYNSTNTYSTLNELTEKTTTVWFICHGMGHLSRYFLRYFETLNSIENYIIAPQAQSKYYLPTKRKHVGASWLTKENTKKETENVMRYFDAIFENESIPGNLKVNVLGYSQGVSVAMRYVAHRGIKIDHLILVSGGIPVELNQSHFEHLVKNTKIDFIYGNQDEYLTESRISSETEKLYNLFGSKAKVQSFNGGHDFNPEFVFKILLNN